MLTIDIYKVYFSSLDSEIFDYIEIFKLLTYNISNRLSIIKLISIGNPDVLNLILELM